jgi:hypothetical protein
VRPSYVVVIGDRDNSTADEMLGVLTSPLASTAGVRRRDQAEGCEAIGVLLAFDHVDHFGRISGEQLGQPVQDAADAFETPRPIGTPLTEALAGIRSDDGVEQLAGLVAIRIESLAGRFVGVGEQVPNVESDGGGDVLDGASRKASEERPAVVADVDG